MAAGMTAAAQAQEPGTDTAAFLAQLTKTYVEAEIAAGAQSEAAYAAARKYILEGPFLPAREARMAQRFGSGCAGLGLDATLESLVRDLSTGAPGDGKRLSLYLTLVQATCPKRMAEDRALLGDVWSTLERAKGLRRQAYDAYLEEERLALVRRERERLERDRLAAAEHQAAEERERQAQAAAKAAEESARAAPPQESRAAKESPGAGSLAGTYRCGTADDGRFLHFGAAGEAVELSSMGETTMAFAGLYRVVGDRVVIRFIADNTWKLFAFSYQQKLADEFAWKRSAIASQKVVEFRVVPLGADAFRIESARTKMLKSGETAEIRRPDCRKLDSDSPTARGLAAHAKLAMRYVDQEHDQVPATLDKASISLPAEIESKKRKEREWFERAPGLVKMMVTDRLLEELRKSPDKNCLAVRTTLEQKTSVAMASINQISESELAQDNPRRAEMLAGRQLDPAFEEYLDEAGRAGCLMEEASAVGL